ncbi:MAG: isochorismatase family protein [Phycisphaerales bacterium]|nr:isochorismatase family protein [Phycisphaerales bacterium]
MAIPRLTTESTALLVIDIQERIIGTIHEHHGMTQRCRALIASAALLKLPIIVTEQYVKGLGHTVSAITEVLPPNTHIIEKTAFSAFTPEVRAQLSELGRTNLLICGIEAHVCVLQSVLDACANGIQTFHATDAISSGQPNQINPAFRRMERAGSIPTGVLSALYELMESCEHPAFRAVLPYAKAVVNPMQQ